MDSLPAGRACRDELNIESSLLDAYRELHDGRNARCMAMLKRLATTDPLSSAMLAVARGRLALERGETDAAEKLFTLAYDRQVPAQAVLRHCAGFFRIAGAPERAYEAHCLLAQFEPDAFNGYWPHLTAAQQYRYACWAPDREAALAAIREGISGEGAALLADLLAVDRGAAVAGAPGLRIAYDAIASGQPEAAVQLSGPLADQGCKVAQGIRAAAWALLARRLGDQPGADQWINEAWRLGSPLPALLQIVGSHSLADPRTGARAFECFSLLERMAPGTTLAFWQALPAPARLRYAPYLFRVNLLAAKPHMYGLRRHKRMVAERFGIAGLAILMSEMTRGEPPAGLIRLPVVGLQDYAREQGEAYDVIGPPREVSMHLPRIVGAEPQEPLEGTSRTVFRCVLENAVVSGKSNLVIAPRAVVMDFQGGEREQLPAHIDFNFHVLEADGDSVAVLQPRATGAAIPDALKLTGAQTSNFGHWTMEYMFQLWACMKQPGFAGLPILIDEQMPAQHRETVEFFAGPGNPVLTVAMGEDIPVARLWTCSKVLYWPGGEIQPTPPVARRLMELADADLLGRMLIELQPKLDSVAEERAAAIKLYLTRGPGQSRQLEGRSEVERFFEQRDFTIIDPAKLTFVEQLRFLRRASIVVLEAGSAVYSLIYCRPGAKVGYFPTYEPPELECIHEVLSRLGHKMIAVAPRAGSEERPEADLDLLAQLLDELEAL